MIGFLWIGINGLRHYAFYYVIVQCYVIQGRMRLNCGGRAWIGGCWRAVGRGWTMGERG